MIFEIDNREPVIIKEYFKNKQDNFICNLKNLEQGDFIIRVCNQNILLIIERKTIEDLLSSVKDYRYLEQCERYTQLNLTNSKIYYIIEGNINRYSIDSIEYKTYYSCIYSLSFKRGFSVLFSNDIQGTKNILEQFLSRISKDILDKKIGEKKIEENEKSNEKSNEGNTLLIKKQVVTKENIDVYMLNLVPGIGLSTGREILKHFDNKIFNLIKELKENSSIGEILNTIKINNRKLSKKIIENINNFLINN